MLKVGVKTWSKFKMLSTSVIYKSEVASTHFPYYNLKKPGCLQLCMLCIMLRMTENAVFWACMIFNWISVH